MTYTDDELRAIRGIPGALDRDLVNDMAVELLAARRELAELRQRREDASHWRLHAKAVEEQRDALRAKLAAWVPKVGDRVTVTRMSSSYYGMSGTVAGEAHLGETPVHIDDYMTVGVWTSALAPAPPPEPPAEGAGDDVGQLRWIAAMGAVERVPVHELTRRMSLHRNRSERCMAVEIAERRLAERPTLPPPPLRAVAPDTPIFTPTGMRFMRDTDPRATALRSIVENSSEVDTVRRAALALLGDGGGR